MRTHPLDTERALELCRKASPHAGHIDSLLFLAVAPEGQIHHHGDYDDVQPHTGDGLTLMAVAATYSHAPVSLLTEVWAPAPLHIPGVTTAPITAFVEITARTGIIDPEVTTFDLPLWDRTGLLEYRDQIIAYNAQVDPAQQVPLVLEIYTKGFGDVEADMATVTAEELKTRRHTIHTAPHLSTVCENYVGPCYSEEVFYSLPCPPGTRWEIAD